MSAKVISTYVTSVDLVAPYNTLSITSTGTVGKDGVSTGFTGSYTIINDGLIHASPTVVNDQYERGVFIGLGQVTNGSPTDTTAEIYGHVGVVFPIVTGRSGRADRVTNFGTISGLGLGIDLNAGGFVTNGSKSDRTALIKGGVGAAPDGPATVVNYGTIETTINGEGYAIRVAGGDVVIAEPGATFIGSVTGGAGVIGGEGRSTFELAAGTGTISGLGTIKNFNEILVAPGATWTLAGTASSFLGSDTINAGTTLVVEGSLASVGFLTNDGTIAGTLNLSGGPGHNTIVNNGVIGGLILGAASDELGLTSTGTVTGTVNVGGGTLGLLGNGEGTLTSMSQFVDFGAILVGGSWTIAAGLTLDVGVTVEGFLTNAADLTLDSGVTVGAGVLSNANSLGGTGTIVLDGSYVFGIVGVRLDNEAGAVISNAVTAIAGGEVKNAGTMAGVRLVAASDTLSISSGAVFSGPVEGGGGKLHLAAGTAGTLTGLGTEFTGFGVIGVDRQASWQLAGSNTLAGGTRLYGALVNAGSLGGTGTLVLSSYYYFGSTSLENKAGAVITNAVTVTGQATVSNAGTMAGVALGRAGDELILLPGAVFTGLVTGGGGTLDLAGAGTLSGLGTGFKDFAQILVDPAGTWTLAGTNAVASGAVLNDQGRLDVAGTLGNRGLIELNGALVIGGATAGTFRNAAGGTLALDAGGSISAGAEFGSTLVNAGLIEKAGGTGTRLIAADVTSSGTIAIGRGTLDLDGAANDLAGTVSGAGTLRLGGGVTTLESGITVTVAAWRVTGSGTGVALATSLSYGGALALGEGTTLDLGRFALALGSAVTLADAAVDGSGFLVTEGASQAWRVTLGGTVTWQNHGVATEVGKVTLGAGARIVNEAGATFDLVKDSGIAAAAGAAFTNDGLLEKTGGSAASWIEPAVTNAGTIAADSGTLAFSGSIAGTGLLEIGGGGTLETASAVAGTQTVDFTAAGASLVILEAARFHASVEGFAQAGTLDFRGIADGSDTTLAYTAGTGGGTLTVSDGTHTARISLLGQFAAAGFATAADGAGGTAVTYTPPTPPRALALATPG